MIIMIRHATLHSRLIYTANIDADTNLLIKEDLQIVIYRTDVLSRGVL